MEYDPIEKQIERAEWAINQRIDSKEKEWLTKLLNILKDDMVATVYDKRGKALDVIRIAHTQTWASFFDVCNLIHRMNLEIDPIVMDNSPGLNRSYYKFIKTN